MPTQIQPDRTVDIEGGLCPFYKDMTRPITFLISGEEGYFISIFSNADDLHAEMQRCGFGLSEYRVKRITDTDFYDSINAMGMRIMMNPRVIEGNKTRWTEIKTDATPDTQWECQN